MEALSVDEVPVGPEWQYEPKWDGFRCLVFRDGNTVTLQSKSGKPLTRYFPDVVEAVRALKGQALRARRRDRRAGGQGVLVRRAAAAHPSGGEPRAEAFAKETPALLIVFDLLHDADGTVLVDEPLTERRKRLEAFARKYFPKNGRIRLSPATTKLADAKNWLKRVGATLDGIIAKRRDLPYRAGDRTGMQKIKNYRSADCVVGGFRYNEGKPVVGSLLLGLYDDDGKLNHVGFTSSIPREDKPALTKKLEKLIAPPGFTGNAPGGPSRWSTERSAEWQPLKPKLVVEVCYDHFSGDRFRHGTRLMRWRPDKAPQQCTMDQVKQKKADLMKLLRSWNEVCRRRSLGGVPLLASASPADSR